MPGAAPSSAATSGPQATDRFARADERCEDGCRQSESPDELVVPLTRLDADEPGRRRVRALRELRPRELEGDEVGHEQEGIGQVEASVAFCCQLVERVERQELQPVAPVQLRERHDRVHGIDPARVAVVAVVERLAEHAVAPEQRVVDGPRVDADARGVGLGAERLTEPREHVAVEPGEVPVQARRESHRAVREARDRSELERARTAAVDAAEHHPAARRPEVDGGDRARSRVGHRRKAAATPASTGMCRPVVWLSSGPVSTNTAFATCSGSTSRLRMVRWA